METLDKIQGKKDKKIAICSGRTGTEKFKAHTECTEANKRVMRSIRADNQKYVEELATTAEKASRERNIRQLYNTTKKLARKYGKPERPTKDKEGETITEIQEQRNRWIGYFEELLNERAPLNPVDIKATRTDLFIDATPSATEETRMAIR
ncbi:unnamed protein product [Schistosoma curassoni]|uniref:SynN domain-containing protein n=1 Tax=Schistosoma curassoni TaxID=6186 RepID=A0A183KZD3_9TREM|nr:unnamed protein product [Schistosoma curassoni]